MRYKQIIAIPTAIHIFFLEAHLLTPFFPPVSPNLKVRFTFYLPTGVAPFEGFLTQKTDVTNKGTLIIVVSDMSTK